MNTISKIIGVLLLLSIFVNAYIFSVNTKKTNRIHSSATAQRLAAEHIFFDSLKDDNIDILTLQPSTFVAVPCHGFFIRICPLIITRDRDGLGSSDFIGRYQGLVLKFACFKWDEDRVLSLSLIKILARVDDNSRILMTSISEKGIDHTDVARRIQHFALIFERCYGDRYREINGKAEGSGVSTIDNLKKGKQHYTNNQKY